jgi:hypothetical protein
MVKLSCLRHVRLSFTGYTWIFDLSLFLDCATGQVEAVPGDCQKYKVCEVTAIGSVFGVWREYACPEGFHFEPASRACLEAREADCNRKPLLRQHTPVHWLFDQCFIFQYLVKCTDKERLTVENCVFFKECSNGTYSLFKCPRAYNPDGTWSNQMFDATTKKCVDKRKIAVPGDCQAYKECVSIGPAFNIEYWRKASCPTSTHFNPSTLTCVLGNEANCCKFLKELRTKDKNTF